MFGVGGGIIKGPLMLEMGVLPNVSSATAACMILFTSAIACMSYFLFGMLDLHVGGILFFIGLGCTAVGQVLTQIFLDRQSVIVLSMGFVVSFSAVLLTLRSVIDITTREDKGSIFAISSFCGDE